MNTNGLVQQALRPPRWSIGSLDQKGALDDR